jgi:hypothetical protein
LFLWFVAGIDCFTFAQVSRDTRDAIACSYGYADVCEKLRTANIIERCFVEVRRRNRPIICLSMSKARIESFTPFQRFNLKWKSPPALISKSHWLADVGRNAMDAISNLCNNSPA